MYKKPGFYYYLSFVLLICLTGILIFIPNKFLFFLYGYKVDPSSEATVESFKAYRTIYPVKISMIFLGFIASIILLISSRKNLLLNGYQGIWFMYLISWVISLIYLAMIIMFFIIPSGSMVM
jgi:hypothetical protein